MFTVRLLPKCMSCSLFIYILKQLFSIHSVCVFIFHWSHFVGQFDTWLSFPRKYQQLWQTALSLFFLVDGTAYQHSHRLADEQLECLRRVRRCLWHPQVITHSMNKVCWHYGILFLYALIFLFVCLCVLAGVLAASPWMLLQVWHFQLRWTLRTTQTTRLSTIQRYSSPFLSSGQSHCFSVSLNYFYLYWHISIITLTNINKVHLHRNAMRAKESSINKAQTWNWKVYYPLLHRWRIGLKYSLGHFLLIERKR